MSSAVFPRPTGASPGDTEPRRRRSRHLPLNDAMVIVRGAGDKQAASKTERLNKPLRPRRMGRVRQRGPFSLISQARFRTRGLCLVLAQT